MRIVSQLRAKDRLFTGYSSLVVCATLNCNWESPVQVQLMVSGAIGWQGTPLYLPATRPLIEEPRSAQRKSHHKEQAGSEALILEENWENSRRLQACHSTTNSIYHVSWEKKRKKPSHCQKALPWGFYWKSVLCAKLHTQLGCLVSLQYTDHLAAFPAAWKTKTQNVPFVMDCAWEESTQHCAWSCDLS